MEKLKLPYQFKITNEDGSEVSELHDNQILLVSELQDNTTATKVQQSKDATVLPEQTFEFQDQLPELSKINDNPENQQFITDRTFNQQLQQELEESQRKSENSPQNQQSIAAIQAQSVPIQQVTEREPQQDNHDSVVDQTVNEPSVDQGEKKKYYIKKLLSFMSEATDKIKSKTFSNHEKIKNQLQRKMGSAKEIPAQQQYPPSDSRSPDKINQSKEEEFYEFKKQDRRQQIIQRMEDEKQKKEEFSKLNKQGNRLIQQIKETIKQKEQIQKEKDDALLIPELEKRKAVLAQKRELSQPIRMDVITEHQKKYEETMKIKMLERQLTKQEHENEIKSKAPKFPKSQAQIRLEEETKRNKQQQQQELEQKKQQRQKQLKYADVVQEIFFKEHPIVPKAKTPTKKENIVINMNVLQGNNRLKKLEKIIQPKRHQSQDSRESLEHKSFQEPVRRPQIKQKLPPKPTQHDEPPPKPKTTDYLQVLKQQRSNQVPLQQQWERIIENEKLPQESKFQNVLQNVQRMEMKAKEKEKLGSLTHNQDAEDEANNLYIASIKAKLALLEA
ncbi:hypothetical protein pb186bvf_005754 [Paramecium bursaria]